MSRNIRAALTAVFALGLTGLVAPMAHAAAPSVGADSLTAAELSQLTTFFDAYDVPDTTQDALIAQLGTDDVWDSFSGASPVSTRTVTGTTAIDVVATFADGSIAVTTLDTPASKSAGGIGIQSVAGCTTSGVGTVNRTLTGCTVRQSLGIVTMAFYADYKYSYHSLSDITVKSASITKVYSASATVLGGTYSDLQVSIVRKAAASSLPAIARASMAASTVGGWAGRTCWLQLNVPIGSTALGYSSYSF